MNILHKVAALTAWAIVTVPSIGDTTTYGVGVSLNNSFLFYFPISIGSLIIEPTFLISDENEYAVDTSISDNFDYRYMQLGVGLFKNTYVIDSTYIYYGARLGYITIESSSNSPTFSSMSEDDGYVLAPTLGAQYLLTKHFSMGIDLALEYTRSNRSFTTTSSIGTPSTLTQESNVTSYNTSANFIIRYIF